MSLRTDPAPLSRRSVQTICGVTGLFPEGGAGHHIWRDEAGRLQCSPYMAWHPDTDVVRLMGDERDTSSFEVCRAEEALAAADAYRVSEYGQPRATQVPAS